MSLAADTEMSLARQANDLARDLARADPKVYWLDLGVTAAVTWLSLWVAVTSPSVGWMLTAGDTPISAVAYECGFADAAHFIRHFQREFGEPPGAFRRRLARAA